MKEMHVELTQWHKDLLQPLFAEIRKQFNDGKPGIIVAQIWEHKDKSELPFMGVRVLDHETTKKIQTALGTKPGAMMPENNEVMVTCPIEG